MKIETLSLGAMDNFIHFIIDESRQQALVIDPAWDADAIQTFLNDSDLALSGILLTHSHPDHTSAIPPLLANHTVPVYIGRQELSLGMVQLSSPTIIADGSTIEFGEISIRVIETPGHTAGSVCFAVDNKALIVGDTLFINGCGRCNFAESDVEQMYDSLQKLKQLPDDMVIYCGHDYGEQATDTLGHQKKTNPYLLIEDKSFFVDFRMHLQGQYRNIPFAPSSVQEMQAIQQRHTH